MKKIGFLGCGKIGKRLLKEIQEKKLGEVLFIQDPFCLEKETEGVPVITEYRKELYDQAEKIYHQRLVQYAHLQHSGFPQKETARFLSAYGNLSFLSGLPCDE